MRVGALNASALQFNSKRIKTAGKRDCKKNASPLRLHPAGRGILIRNIGLRQAMTLGATAIFETLNLHGQVGESILTAVTFM